MNRVRSSAAALALLVIAIVVAAGLSARQGPSIAGRWTLNRAQSQFPRDVGFGMDVVPPGGDRADTDGTGLTGSMRGNNPRPVSEEQARNEQQLVGDVRTPPAYLVITQSDELVTVATERGMKLVLHTDGREEFQQLQAGAVTTVAKWDGPKLVIRFKVQADRELRYTLSRASDTAPLLVQTQFIERGGRGVITRLYDSAKPGDPALEAPTAAPTSGAPGSARPGPGSAQPAPGNPAQPGQPRTYQPGQPLPPGGQPGAPPGTVPASPEGLVPAAGARDATAPVATRPGSELRGLTTLGVVVEELSPAAVTCGLQQSAVESLVTKGLTDAGLKVVHNTDEDTYLYVRVVTTAMTTGFCFSRYDAIVYTNATATPTYGSAPALVQVELLRNGGLTGGGASQHADSVMSSLRQYVSGFVTRIRDANK